MKVNCTVCKVVFEAKRSSARFCGATCRQRAARGSPTPRSPVPVLASSEPVTSLVHPLVEQTRRELEDVGQLDTVLGQQALRLAEKMAGTFDTGSAMAAVSREFRAVMADALANSPKKADSLDELSQRRALKASGA